MTLSFDNCKHSFWVLTRPERTGSWPFRVHIYLFMIVSDEDFADAIRLDFIANIVGLVCLKLDIESTADI